MSRHEKCNKINFFHFASSRNCLENKLSSFRCKLVAQICFHSSLKIFSVPTLRLIRRTGLRTQYDYTARSHTSLSAVNHVVADGGSSTFPESVLSVKYG